MYWIITTAQQAVTPSTTEGSVGQLYTSMYAYKLTTHTGTNTNKHTHTLTYKHTH